MTVEEFGAWALVEPADEERCWSNADFARNFLRWLVVAYPACAGKWMRPCDIRKLFPQFKAETGCRHLQLGSLLRGLGGIVQKTESTYTDATGRRRPLTGYHVAIE